MTSCQPSLEINTYCYSNMYNVFFRLQDDCRNLSMWLTNQEEKWKEMEESKEKPELFYQALTKKRYSGSCIKYIF